MAKKNQSKKKSEEKSTNRKTQAKLKFSDLIQACEDGDLKTVLACIDSKLNVNKKDEYGFTPLHRAVTTEGLTVNKHKALVQTLIDAGSKLDVKTKDGRTAFYLAAEFCERKDVLVLLVNAGAKPDIYQFDVHTMLDAATPSVRKYLKSVLGVEAAKKTSKPQPVTGFQKKKLSASDWRRVKKKLDQVFELLRNQNVVALQNVGTTQEDGFSDCAEIVDELGGIQKSGVVGFCFYSSQDLQRAKKESGLLLSIWGAPMGSKTATVKIGKLVRKTFQKEGFEFHWDGSASQRPVVDLNSPD